MILVHLLGQAFLGFSIGAIAKFLVFADNPNNWLIHALIGAFGAIGGTKIARFIFGIENNKAGWIFAFSGSIIFLGFIYFYKK
jgi:uncharacterized membrane protein YeaQ/YmgE (transglycosylase-associated protein family)